MQDKIIMMLKIMSVSSLVFLVCSVVLPAIVAVNIAVFIAFGYAFLPENRHDMLKFKRPELYVRR